MVIGAPSSGNMGTMMTPSLTSSWMLARRRQRAGRGRSPGRGLRALLPGWGGGPSRDFGWHLCSPVSGREKLPGLGSEHFPGSRLSICM